MEEKTTYIYKLVDPREPEVVRYIGKSNEPEARLRQHIHAVKTYKKNRYVYCWIKSLLKCGIEPLLQIVEEIKYNVKEEWASREQFWITYYKDLGHPLTNLTDGGDGLEGYKHSEATCKKMSLKKKGKPGHKPTEAHKQAVSRAQKGKKDGPMPEEQKEKIRAKLKGVPKGPMSDEAKKNMSEAQKGKKQSPEQIAKRIETKRKNGTMGNNVPRPPEVREKLRIANLGKKQSPETVAKRVAATLATKAKKALENKK